MEGFVPESVPSSNPSGWFTTTHWSLVLSAQTNGSPQAGPALEQLCRTYWYPLYAYVRRQGRSAEDAQDLTQAFFARLLAGNSLNTVEPRKGKFRTFLLAAMNHFLAEDWHRARRQKRGGGRPVLSLDETSTEERYSLEPVDEMNAERIYERRWALTLLDQVLARLQEEVAASGRAAHFDVLKDFLQGHKASYQAAAAQIGTSEVAVRVAVHRLRRRYGELLRAEIAHTVTLPEEIENELGYLMTVLAR